MKSSQIYLCAALIAALCMDMANAEETRFSYSNVTSSHVTTFVRGADPVEVTKLNINVARASAVLFQFSSAISAESAEGCPCSVRAMVSVDGQEPRIIKRINVGSPEVSNALHYQYDRQALDGTTVFDVAPGPHTFTLLFRQVSGSSKKLEVNYPNAQAFVISP